MNTDKQEAIHLLKNQYQQIPVPEETKERLMKGIRQAKEELGLPDQSTAQLQAVSPNSRQSRDGKTRILSFFKPAAATAAAAMAAIVVLANSTPTIAMAMERLPVIGAIAQVVTFRTYESQEGGFEAKVDIPEISRTDGGDAIANQDIEHYARQLIDQYEADLRASSGDDHYSLTSSWDVVFENDRYVAIRIRTTQVMASGTEYVKIFNVDKQTGETVSLKELLGNDSQLLDAISANIKEQMRTQMAEDDSVTYFLDSDMPEWDFAGLTGEESYYFNKDGLLVIVFDEYQVAPGYMGAVEFTIPESVSGKLADLAA